MEGFGHASVHLLDNTLESKLDIAIDLITPQFFLYNLIVFLTIVFILKQYRSIKINQVKSPLLILAIIAIISFYGLNTLETQTLKF